MSEDQPQSQVQKGTNEGQPVLSFQALKLITEEMLADRLAEVKMLSEEANDCYRLVKDQSTGEHYLHYAVRHLHLFGGGAEEHYHHLLPLAQDDVIAFALGEPWSLYPDAWQSAYLRNGPYGGYVWYDPAGASAGAIDYEAAAAAIREKLLAFGRDGNHTEEDLRQLLEEMDRMLPRQEEG